MEKFSNDPRVANNLGIAYMMEGNLDSAERYFNMAKSAGVVEASLNLIELEKKRDDNKRLARYANRD